MISQTGATLNGNGNPNGLATQAWFEYGTDPALSTFITTEMQLIGDGSVDVPVGQSVSGCIGGTVYYFRVCGVNTKGTTKSTIANFTTSSLGADPTVATLAATSVAATGATLNANVTPNGLATTAWFEWGTAPALITYTTTPEQSVGSGTPSLLVNAALSGLSTGTTYYYRVAASNSSGTSKGSITAAVCHRGGLRKPGNQGLPYRLRRIVGPVLEEVLETSSSHTSRSDVQRRRLDDTGTTG